MNPKIQLTDNIFEATNLFEKIGNELFHELGLTVKTFSILIKIKKGKNTTKELAAYIQGTPASITQKTKILEERKLIKRTVDKKDRRIWYFTLTQKGETSLEKAMNIYKSKANEVYSDFSKSEIKEFIKLNEKLLKKLIVS